MASSFTEIWVQRNQSIQSKRAASPAGRQPYANLRSPSPSVNARRKASASPLPRTSLISPRLKPVGAGSTSGHAGEQRDVHPGVTIPGSRASPLTHGGSYARDEVIGVRNMSGLPPREDAPGLAGKVILRGVPQCA